MAAIQQDVPPVVDQNAQDGNGHSSQTKGYMIPLIIMLSLFFMFGFVTSLNDILIPHLKGLFDLSFVQAMLVQGCFFGAYFVMSTPSGWLIGKIGYKKAIVVALTVLGAGLAMFLPASALASYPVFLTALFIVGSGIALLQVAANPYVAALGKPEHAASRLNLAGVFNSLATTVAPLVGAWLVLDDTVVDQAIKAEATNIPYIGLAILTVLIAVAVTQLKLPALPSLGGTKSINITGSALDFSHLRLGVLAIFMYVGAEVTLGSFIINFAGLEHIAGLGESDAAEYVAMYWGGAMVGRIAGVGLLQKFKSEKALALVAVLALVSVITGVVLTGTIALWAIVAIGLFNAIMWPCIFPLAIKDLGEHTNQGSGYLVMAIVGGAVMPLLQGYLADLIGVQSSFLLVAISYGYILFYALKGHKIKAVK